jgi:hypothetical protein
VVLVPRLRRLRSAMRPQSTERARCLSAIEGEGDAVYTAQRLLAETLVRRRAKEYNLAVPIARGNGPSLPHELHVPS